jgi:hypothetical protein
VKLVYQNKNTVFLSHSKIIIDNMKPTILTCASMVGRLVGHSVSLLLVFLLLKASYKCFTPFSTTKSFILVPSKRETRESNVEIMLPKNLIKRFVLCISVVSVFLLFLYSLFVFSIIYEQLTMFWNSQYQRWNFLIILKRWIESESLPILFISRIRILELYQESKIQELSQRKFLNRNKNEIFLCNQKFTSIVKHFL